MLDAHSPGHLPTEIHMSARPIPVLLLSLFALGSLAATSRAQIIIEPDPRFSTVDAVVVGSPLGVPIGGSPAGYDVTMRDNSNAPRPGVVVALRFPAGSFRLYADQQAGTTIDCAQATISRITDGQGRVNFAAKFGGWNDANSVEVVGDGVSLAFVKGRSPDYDGDGRVALSDLVTFSSDFLTNPSAQRSDFDLNGSTGLGDLVLFVDQFLHAGGPQPLCP
jgi:hypothetical protein